MSCSSPPSPEALPFVAEQLRRTLTMLTSWGPRAPDDRPALEKTVAFLRDVLSSEGYDTHLHRFDTGPGDCNLLAERCGQDPSQPVLEIGAHFDTVPGSPGADDNGSGVVGLLAIARYFARRPLLRGVRFCFFGREETGLMGSKAHQLWLDKEGRPFAGCVVFEMIGCRNRTERSQGSPFRIPFLLWPPKTGDFIALLSNRKSRPLATLFQKARPLGRDSIPVYPITRVGGLLKDAVRSDHASYWRAGRPAIMLTDTANFRNPHYHKPTDTVETIDFEFLSDIARATASMADSWATRPPAPSSAS